MHRFQHVNTGTITKGRTGTHNHESTFVVLYTRSHYTKFTSRVRIYFILLNKQLNHYIFRSSQCEIIRDEWQLAKKLHHKLRAAGSARHPPYWNITSCARSRTVVNLAAWIPIFWRYSSNHIRFWCKSGLMNDKPIQSFILQCQK